MTWNSVDALVNVQTLKKITGIALLSVTALLATGCSDNCRQTVELLQAENQEYMQANEELQQELDKAVEQRTQLVQQNHELVNENSRLREEARLAKEQAQQPVDPWKGIQGVTGEQRTGEIVAQVQGDVLFAPGSVTLRKEAKKTLDKIASVLNSTFAGHVIRVAGHTDSDPIKKSSWKTNDRLSCERAMAVKNYLESKGVDGNRIYVAGYGATRPLATKSASRRVEIIVLAEQQ